MEERENTKEIRFMSETYGDKIWWFNVWDVVYKLSHKNTPLCIPGNFKITIEFYPEGEENE